MKLPKFLQKDDHKTEKEKLEERREEVLATGRKFKYPMQYAKHRLVFITIIVAVVALLAAGVFGYVRLYKAQDSGDVLYRLTTVLPVSVAKIDGEKVRYSDYLMIYRSSIMPVEQQNGVIGTGADAESLRNYYKRQALDSAEDYAYAMKLARQLNVSVSDEMVDEEFVEHRKLGGAERSEESFLKVLKDNFGLSKTEYRRMLYMSLVKLEVSKKIDTTAEEIATAVEKALNSGETDFAKIATAVGAQYESTGDLVDVMNVDGGRATAAYELPASGAISSRIVSSNGDGYYFVKLSEKTDGKVKYSSIFVPFTELAQRTQNAREENRVEEYIEIRVEESAEE